MTYTPDVLRTCLLTITLLTSAGHAATIDPGRAANATTAYINALNTTYAVLRSRAPTLNSEQLTRAVKPGVHLTHTQHTLAHALLRVRLRGSGPRATIETVCRATGVTVARAHNLSAAVIGRCNVLP